jgi:hypothetical protein
MSTGTSIGIALPHKANATSCRQDDQITMIVEDIHLTGVSLGRTPSGLIHPSPQTTLKTPVTAAGSRSWGTEKSEQLASPDDRVAPHVEG